MTAFDPFRQKSGYVAFAYVATSGREPPQVTIEGCPVGDSNASPVNGDVSAAYGTDRDDALNRTSYRPADKAAWELHERGEGLPYDVFIREVVAQ